MQEDGLAVPWQDTVPGPLITRSPEGSSFAVNANMKTPNNEDILDDILDGRTPRSQSPDPLRVNSESAELGM